MTNAISLCLLQTMTIHSFFTIHYMGPFGIVVCLGVIQIVVTYYGSSLAIESLPVHVSDARRRRHRNVYAVLLLAFVILTFALAKLNDSNQYAAVLTNQRQVDETEALREQLKETTVAIERSENELGALQGAVALHPPGGERSRMLDSLTGVQQLLHQQTMAMRQVDKQMR